MNASNIKTRLIRQTDRQTLYLPQTNFHNPAGYTIQITLTQIQTAYRLIQRPPQQKVKCKKKI